MDVGREYDEAVSYLIFASIPHSQALERLAVRHGNPSQNALCRAATQAVESAL